MRGIPLDWRSLSRGAKGSSWCLTVRAGRHGVFLLGPSPVAMAMVMAMSHEICHLDRKIGWLGWIFDSYLVAQNLQLNLLGLVNGWHFSIDEWQHAHPLVLHRTLNIGFGEFHPKFEPPTLKQKTGLFFSVYDMHLKIAELVDGEVESISLGVVLELSFSTRGLNGLNRLKGS